MASAIREAAVVELAAAESKMCVPSEAPRIPYVLLEGEVDETSIDGVISPDTVTEEGAEEGVGFGLVPAKQRLRFSS